MYGALGQSPKAPYILRAARRRGCASKAQDKVSPRGKAPGRFWPPYAGGHSYLFFFGERTKGRASARPRNLCNPRRAHGRTDATTHSAGGRAAEATAQKGGTSSRQERPGPHGAAPSAAPRGRRARRRRFATPATRLRGASPAGGATATDRGTEARRGQAGRARRRPRGALPAGPDRARPRAAPLETRTPPRGAAAGRAALPRGPGRNCGAGGYRLTDALARPARPQVGAGTRRGECAPRHVLPEGTRTKAGRAATFFFSALRCILRFDTRAATICRGEAEAPPLFRSSFPCVPIGRIVVCEVFVRLHPSPRLYFDVAVTGKSRSHFRPDVAVYRGMARRA